MPRRRGALVAVAVLVILGGAGMIAGGMTGAGHPASVLGAPSPGDVPGTGAPGSQPGGAALCNSQRLAVDGGVYTVQNNEWGSGAAECVAVTGSGGFTVTRSAIGNPASGAPGGAELMIWLNHNGPVRPFGSRVSTAVIGGRSYDVWFGRQAWKTISYSMTAGTTSVRDLDIGQFAADALRRGYIGKSWYLIDVEAGFELWQGGAGLATDSFAVNVPGASSAPIAAGPATTRPAPGSAPVAATASCTVTYSVVHTWPGGYQAQAVLTNTSTSPVSGWTLTWAFPGDQRVAGLWNGEFTQSGERARVTNASYNKTIAPSASVTIGFTGTSTGSDAPPAAFQLNGTECKT